MIAGRELGFNQWALIDEERFVVAACARAQIGPRILA
jgi:hypothetical protein